MKSDEKNVKKTCTIFRNLPSKKSTWPYWQPEKMILHKMQNISYGEKMLKGSEGELRRNSSRR